MKTFNLLALAAIAMSACSVTAWAASNKHDAYFAEMERMATMADKNDSQSTQTTRNANLPDGMARLRKTSPTAYAVFRQLRPAFQEEVRKAIISGKDSRAVAKLIFARNKQSLYGKAVAQPLAQTRKGLISSN